MIQAHVGHYPEAKKSMPSGMDIPLSDGGPDEDRTRYLLLAKQALSQMSYRPSGEDDTTKRSRFQRISTSWKVSMISSFEAISNGR